MDIDQAKSSKQKKNKQKEIADEGNAGKKFPAQPTSSQKGRSKKCQGEKTVPTTSQRGRPKGRKTGEVERDSRNKLIMSKCNVNTAMTFLDDVVEKLTEEDIEALGSTPFLHLLRMPHILACRPQLHQILLSYSKEKQCFQVKGVDLCFKEEEVCIILGLPYGGGRVEIGRKMSEPTSKIHTKFFKGAPAITKGQLEQKIVELLSEKHDKSEMAGLLIMYIFTTILFTQTNGNVPTQFFKYVDNINKIHDFCWGRAVFWHLSQNIEKCADWVQQMEEAGDERMNKNTKGSYLPGCTFALVVWFYEHLKNQDWVKKSNNIPRYVNWHLDKYPKRSTFQNQIDKTLKGNMIETKLEMSGAEKIVYDEGFIANKYRDIIQCDMQLCNIKNRAKQVLLKSFGNILKEFEFPVCPTLLAAQETEGIVSTLEGKDRFHEVYERKKRKVRPSTPDVVYGTPIDEIQNQRGLSQLSEGQTLLLTQTPHKETVLDLFENGCCFDKSLSYVDFFSSHVCNFYIKPLFFKPKKQNETSPYFLEKENPELQFYMVRWKNDCDKGKFEKIKRLYTSGFALSCELEDFKTLLSCESITHNILNCGLQLLLRNTAICQPTLIVNTKSTDFFKKGDHEDIFRFTPHLYTNDFWMCRWIFIPQNDNDHWWLLSCDKIEKKIFLVNSMLGDESQDKLYLRKSIVAISWLKEFLQWRTDDTTWADVVPTWEKEVTPQALSTDCALYVMRYIYCIMTDQKLNSFDQDLVKDREVLAYNLLTDPGNGLDEDLSTSGSEDGHDNDGQHDNDEHEDNNISGLIPSAMDILCKAADQICLQKGGNVA